MTKKIFVSVIIIFQSLLCFSQTHENEIFFELRYPIPIGDNFLNNNTLGGSGHDGIIDLGIDYNIFELKNIGLGLVLNTTILRLAETDVTTLVFSPKIKMDYQINLQKFSLVPQIGFGYSLWRYKGPEMDVEDEYGNLVHLDNKKTENGLSFKGSMKFIFRNSNKINWYIQLAYEFTRLEKPKHGEIDSNYNRNIQLIYPGIGIAWKFNNK